MSLLRGRHKHKSDPTVEVPSHQAGDGNTVKAHTLRLVQHHPWVSLGTLLAIVTAVPSLLTVGGWLGGFVVTPRDLKDLHATVTEEIKTAQKDTYIEIGKVKAELDTQERQWVGIMKTQYESRALAARARVNDCNIRERDKKKGPMSDLENNACDQYRNDLETANRLFLEAEADAKKKWRQ